MRSCTTLGARMSHKHTQTHKTHQSPDLGEATTFPLIVLYVPGHRAYTQMLFCPRTSKLGIPKFFKLGLLQLWKPKTFYENIWLRSGLKQSCSPCRELFNDMLHATCKQINQGDFWLLVVRNQINSLIPGLSFGHNLCFKYPNGWCEPISKI
jgi:hypothetical protein